MANRFISLWADRTLYGRKLFASATGGTADRVPVTNSTGVIDSAFLSALPVSVLAVPKIGVITQTILKSAFTDGGAAVGTFVMTDSVPVGAILLGSKVLVNVAWSGDTTAALTIGDGSDVDRYNTSTIDLFTLAAAGVQSGVPSGNKLIVTANTPTLTVTSTADFTNVNVLGSITVSNYYLQTV